MINFDAYKFLKILSNNCLSYSLLLGEWSFNRVFDNGNTSYGKVLFKFNNKNEFIYSETGNLKIKNGKVLRSNRKYIYSILKNELQIYFYETPKLLFQSIQLKNNDGILHGISSHQCIEDCYISNYIFKPNLEFEIIHNVTGPRKNYSSHTTYNKLI